MQQSHQQATLKIIKELTSRRRSRSGSRSRGRQRGSSSTGRPRQPRTPSNSPVRKEDYPAEEEDIDEEVPDEQLPSQTTEACGPHMSCKDLRGLSVKQIQISDNEDMDIPLELERLVSIFPAKDKDHAPCFVSDDIKYDLSNAHIHFEENMFVLLAVAKNNKDNRKRHSTLSGKCGAWVLMHDHDIEKDEWSGKLLEFKDSKIVKTTLVEQVRNRHVTPLEWS
jgi:hypothetical protein